MKGIERGEDIKIYRPHRYGVHAFDKCEHLNFLDLLKLEEVPSLLPEYASECNNQICIETIKDKIDKSRIFIYGEYIKRKFYIDCLIENNEDNYLQNKNNKHYIQKIFYSFEEVIKDTEVRFIHPELRTIFSINSDFEECKSFKASLVDFNRYNLIKKIFYYNIRKLKLIFKSPKLFSSIMTSEDIDYIYESFSDKPCSLYLCERLLYALSQPDIVKIMSARVRHNKRVINNLKNFRFYYLLEILFANFITYFNMSFLLLYRCIIDKYSMYMHELFRISDMGTIISNNFDIDKLPRFFFLPIEPSEDIYAYKNIKFNFNTERKNITIDIDLDNKIDSLGIAKFVYDCLIVSLYQHKQNLDLNYSEKEISYFSKLIDFNNKYNVTDKLKDRIYGLYMWDKINRPFSKKSISWVIKDMLKKYPDTSHSSKQATDKKYTRIYNSTRQSIEKLEYLPLK